jgi:hypothetical protein
MTALWRDLHGKRRFIFALALMGVASALLVAGQLSAAAWMVTMKRLTVAYIGSDAVEKASAAWAARGSKS